MWKFEHTISVDVSKKVIWHLWTQLDLWPEFDADLVEAALHGEFAPKTTGKMKIHESAVISFEITEVLLEQRFTTVSKMPGGAVIMTHEMFDAPGGTQVVYTVKITGWLSWLWSWRLGKRLKKTVPASLEGLAQYALAHKESLEAIVAVPADAAPAPEEELPEQTPVENAPVHGDGAESSEQAAQEAVTQEATERAEQAQNTDETVEESEEQSVVAEEEDAAQAVMEENIVGDPDENEMRKKDIREQIEHAAHMPQPEIKEAAPEIEKADDGDMSVERAVPLGKSEPAQEDEEPAESQD